MPDMHNGDAGLGKRGPQDPGGKVAERKRAEARAKALPGRVYEFSLEDLARVFAHAEKRMRAAPASFVSEARYAEGPEPFAAQGKCDRFIRFAKEIGLMP